MARPTKLTPEIIESIADGIRSGLFLDQACHLAGISPSTFYLWRKEARKGTEPHASLLEAVDKAEAEAMRDALDVIREASHKDWKAAVWYLQHRWPTRWETGNFTDRATYDPNDLEEQVRNGRHGMSLMESFDIEAMKDKVCLESRRKDSPSEAV